MNRLLEIEILKNFLLKTRIMMGVFIAIVILQLIGGTIGLLRGFIHVADLQRAVFVPVFIVVVVVTEYLVYRHIRTRLAQNKPVKNIFFYAVSVMESTFPTIVMAFGILFVGNPHITPYMILNSPPELMYIIFLLVAALLLDARLCYLLGVLIAGEYILLCTTLLGDKFEVEFFMTVIKSLLFLICGILAGILSKTIRSSVLASLESQRVLIEELDTKVTEKTAEINRQKEIVEEKQREILGSIAYAKRLQQAILVRPEEIGKYLPESFLLYKPKDIVAGDFYFFEVTEEQIFIAAADCTGHGVPGAMVSMVCSNALTRCVREFRLNDPGKILDKTRELVIETFEKSGQDVKDGMDISLVALDRSTRQIYWAGSNNPLWYCSNGAMHELKGDKQPIGRAENMKPFTTHRVETPESTCFYLITDGFADQFGGPKGKKFKYRQLKERIVQIQQLSFDAQHSHLLRVLHEWKGDMEQVDDICIIGFRA